jgi:hypothetical protein
MLQEPGPGGRAPRWALPVLAAFRVAQRRPHYLRRLPDREFDVVAKACDHFVFASTLPALVLALPFLPSPGAIALIAAASLWGLAVLTFVGAPIAAERHRRRQLTHRQ